MRYSIFDGMKISKLGFGTMRLPEINGNIDQQTLDRMVDECIAGGVNYFDTAYPYHSGMSEIAIGRSLSRYDRHQFLLATKYPGHQIAESYDPAEVFEKQLKKCKVDYFDFYLLHNVYEDSIKVYTDKRWGIVDYFCEQVKAGKIKHLGFSCHGRLDNLKEFLDLYGDKMEFCQIQLNYLDWTLQDAKSKYELLCEYGIPVWVMEPVRGGRLAKLNDSEISVLKKFRPNESPAAWCFRWIEELTNVKVILSGMSDEFQVRDNIATFSKDDPLNDKEKQLLLDLAEKMKKSVPCTACRYCCDSCPMELDIPLLISAYNDVHFGLEGSLTASMQLDALPRDKWPTACIGCGACAASCPQKIDIPKVFEEFSGKINSLPKWSEICKKRAEEEKNIICD